MSMRGGVVDVACHGDLSVFPVADPPNGRECSNTVAAAPPNKAQRAVSHESVLDYSPPDWGGIPSIEDEVSFELIVKGEVRARVVLNVQAKQFFTIGRAKTCDVVLDGVEPRASRIHCILQCKAGCPELYVYDLNSAHGTLLNNTRVTPRTFEPLRVGSQLRFTADKRSADDCLAVLCGPEDAMEEEGVVDLDAYRRDSAKVHAARAKALEDDLQRRIEAKRQRMLKESKRKVFANHFAEKGRLRMEAAREAEEEDRKILHTVTWGMSEDAVEPESNLSEGALKLMDANGRLDLEKIRAMELTDKQQKLVATIDQKQRRLNNLEREKAKHEGKCKSNEKKRAAKKSDMSDEFDDVADMDPSGKSLELVQNLSIKIDSVEEDLGLQTDNLLLSLGLKKAGEEGRRPKKKKVEMYDTNFASLDDDDFFDRTAVRKANVHDARETLTSSELAGLPTLEKVENLVSLEAKAVLLKAEQVKLTVHLAAEAAKEREGLRGLDTGECEDSLDAFMSGTVAELRKDRQGKLQLRMNAVDARLQETEAMLQIARRNAPESARPVASSKSVTVSGAAAAVVKAAAANMKAVSAADATVSACANAAGAAAPPHKTKGPQRPATPPATSSHERSAAPHAAPGGAPGEARTKRGPERPPVAVLESAQVARQEEVPAATPPPLRPAPARRGLVDADRGGLQLVGGCKRGGPPPGPPSSSMPPPPAPKAARKVYGAARPPPPGLEAPTTRGGGLDPPPPPRSVAGESRDDPEA